MENKMRLNKDELLYFFRRYRLLIIAIVAVAIIGLIITICLMTRNKSGQQINGPIEPPNNSAISSDGTTYEPDYVETNFELKQLIVEGDWQTGQQYRVYFDRIKNEYSAWKIEQTSEGSILRQIDYNFTIVGTPSELKEIPSSYTTGIDTLDKLDEDFYLYTDLSQVYSYVNAQLNNGYSLKYLRVQSNMCEAYFVKLKTAYHLLATDNMLMIAPYEGALAQGMIDSETAVSDESTGIENIEQESQPTSTPSIELPEVNTDGPDVILPGLDETPPVYGPSMEEETNETEVTETTSSSEEETQPSEEATETTEQSDAEISKPAPTNKNIITQLEE